MVSVMVEQGGACEYLLYLCFMSLFFVSHRCDATLELNRLFEAEIAYKHGHSALSDEERNEAVQFWANKFGSEHYSVCCCY